MKQHYSQVLVIGAGLAGATAALVLADAGLEVTLCVSGNELDGGNSALAQGGIVHCADTADAALLKTDTLIAGHEHNFLDAVDFITQHGSEVLEKILLERVYVPFDRKADGRLHYTREGGHSSNRILHCADHTGREIMKHVLAAVVAAPNIRVLTRHTAIDLITTHHHPSDMTFRYRLENECLGAYIFSEENNRVAPFLADWTVLATGGVGQVYLHTTNRTAANGSGIAMASRAGVQLENMEYVQFHPTALYHPNSNRFLITEALRGEGGVLVDAAGQAFMSKYAPDQRDLAPRDIVARAIMNEMLHSGAECMYLDLGAVALSIPKRFPTIYRRCLELGIDIEKSPIPIVPVAHYFCGGILTNTQGRSTLQRLYAVGECACTGVHGANRLASTSLLEALLWGHAAAQDIKTRSKQQAGLAQDLRAAIPPWKASAGEHNDDPALIAQDWAAIRTTMWNYVGITRSQKRLKRAFDDLRALSRRLHDFYNLTPVSKPLIDLFHGCQTAYVITQAALRNTKSLGCHFRND